MTSKILVVESSLFFQKLITGILRRFAEIKISANYEDAKKRISQGVFDIIFIDTGLPEGKAYELCKELSQSPLHGRTNLILTSGNDDINEKLSGFSAGADDYVTKPFLPRLLQARIIAKLKPRDGVNNKYVSFGGLSMDFIMRQVYLSVGQTQVRSEQLTRVEFDILFCLVRKANTVVTRESIRETVWGKQIHISNRAIDTHVCNLRKKLGGLGSMVKSVYGAGYTVAPPAPKAALV